MGNASKRKNKKKLEARIRGYESIVGGKGANSGSADAFHKPGSMKK